MVPSYQEVVDLIQANPDHLVWGYVRVSDEQQVSGYSLEGQQSAIMEYCLRAGLSQPLFVVEEASSRRPLFMPSLDDKRGTTVSRPKMMLLLGHLKQMEHAHLVVYAIDRLARNLSDQEMIFRLLWDANNSVHSTLPTESDLLSDGAKSDPQRVLFRQLLGAFKQYESYLIEMRMRSGAITKGARGGYTGGRPPFGYAMQGGDLVPDPDKAHMVRLAVYLSKVCGWSSRQVASYLNEHKSPNDETKYHHVRVLRILSNLELYEGRYTNTFGDAHARDDLIIVPRSTDVLYQLITEYSHHEPARRGPGAFEGHPEEPSGRLGADRGGGAAGDPCPEEGGGEQGVDGSRDCRVARPE